MFGSRLNGILSGRVSNGEFLFTLPAKSTILNWNLLRDNVSDCQHTDQYSIERKKTIVIKKKKGVVSPLT